MHKEINSITKHLFKKEDLEQVGVEEIEDIISLYPYFAPARYLLAKKTFDKDNEGAGMDNLVTAGLYINNPLRLNWLLHHDSFGDTTVNEVEEPVKTETADNTQPAQSTDELPIVFQSYHTIDYFASQGIRLQQADLTKDKFGQQLKSFTEWLRSMKKLPSSASGSFQNPEEDNHHQFVIRSAAHSIEGKEIFTEAMAEVWAKQGNTGKAIEIYNKLSLQNPAKSGYFAAKIDQLKAL